MWILYYIYEYYTYIWILYVYIWILYIWILYIWILYIYEYYIYYTVGPVGPGLSRGRFSFFVVPLRCVDRYKGWRLLCTQEQQSIKQTIWRSMELVQRFGPFTADVAPMDWRSPRKTPYALKKSASNVPQPLGEHHRWVMVWWVACDESLQLRFTYGPFLVCKLDPP